MSDGQGDLDRAARALASRLPEPLGVLAHLAYNYRWSWLPDGAELFRALEAARWTLCGANPVRFLQEVPAHVLSDAAADPAFLDRMAEAARAVSADPGVEAPYPGGPSAARPAAFFCAEYAVHASLPIYSGGLGALAGDLLKQASDQGVPMVAVGLMYRQGYFRQRIDGSGWQHEYWTLTDPERLPAALVTGADGRALTVTVPILGAQVTAQWWRVNVGRVALYLLDTERPENERVTRWITSRLYVSDPELRLAQYVLLGLGGVRALRAMGISPALVHLNEGHAAFASLEMVREELSRGRSLAEALQGAQERTVFTTHTPVPAGNDTYPVEQVSAALAPIATELGVDVDVLARMGRSHPDETAEPFGVTQFALRTSRSANAVSRRHGEVGRDMWQELWPGRPVADVPINHVTNGVHVPTWIGAPIRRLLDRHLPAGWLRRTAAAESWAAIENVPSDDLWAARNEQRRQLVEYVRDRSVTDRLGRGDLIPYARAAAEALDPDVLTVGFARRLATYKRLGLLIADWAGSLELLGGERPIQLVLAGKAHPRDEEAKRRLQDIFAAKGAREVAERVVFLDDYDLESAALLVRGCDVWVNLPRPPLEASGTSGMKAVVNGGLHLSVLDGWWAEAYDGHNGWSLAGDIDPDHEAQDARDGAELRRLIAEEVLPAFHDRDTQGLPQAWLTRVRASMRSLGPAFSAGRMLDDYVQRIYHRPAP